MFADIKNQITIIENFYDDCFSNLIILGTLLLMDIIQHKLECQTKCGISSSSGTTFVPSFLRVHPDGAIFIAVSANKAVIQGFDIALNPIR